jgi:hypothetical protein
MLRQPLRIMPTSVMIVERQVRIMGMLYGPTDSVRMALNAVSTCVDTKTVTAGKPNSQMITIVSIRT